jgi:hypothetical protein
MTVLLSAALAGLLDVALRLRGSIDQPWPENALAIALAANLAALPALTTIAVLLARKLDLESSFFGFWLLELLLTAVSAWLLPEASYLFAVPALAATLLAFSISAKRQFAAELALLGSALAQVLVWAPVAGLAFDALGVALPALCAALGALLIVPWLGFAIALAPLLRQRLLLASTVAALVAAAVAVAGDARSPNAPARVSLAHHFDVNSGEGRFLLDAARVPPELASAHFASNSNDRFPWFGGGLLAHFAAPAPALARATARATLVSEKPSAGGGRELELELTPTAPGALALSLGFPAAKTSGFRVNGEPAVPILAGEQAVLGVLSDEGASVRVQVRSAGSGPISLLVAELASGLPAEAQRLARLRNGPSSASQTGDITIASQRLVF